MKYQRVVAARVGRLRVGVDEPGRERQLRHDRGRDLRAAPDGLAAAAIVGDVDPLEARCRRRALRRGGRAAVPVVVLDDQRATDSDQRVVGGARTLLEDRRRAGQPRARHGSAAPVDDHVHRVGVVGDRHVLGAHQRRRGPGPGAHLAGLAHARVRVLLAPGDGRRAARIGVEPVQRGVGDDVDAAGLVDRERVRDLLVRVERADRSRLGLDRADDARLRDPPDAARPVRQRREELVVQAQGPRSRRSRAPARNRGRAAPRSRSTTQMWRFVVGITARSRWSR